MKMKYLQIRSFRQLWLADRGIAAIEFAFIAPLFFFIFMSVVALYSQGVAEREVQQSSADLADVVARYTHINDSRVDTLGLNAVALLKSTPHVTDVRIAVANIRNPDGAYQTDYEVLWQATYNGANEITEEFLQSDVTKVPIIRKKLGGHEGDTIVLFIVEADYKPFFEIPGVTSEKTFVRKAWAYPRYSQSIEYQH